VTVYRAREVYEREELERLAPAAVKSAQSHGRLHAEPEHAYRTAFQRDRDRIVHARAFRRLEYKTQVFVAHVGDHYRNRLTHTLEGAQIARTIARALRLNEDLAEAIVLAHDLGHTPVGHAGERVLATLMKGDGGFDHNRQSLRIVDWLEDAYPDFPGLNLCYETREGLLKHGAPWQHPVPVPALRRQPSLEAQVADLADEIAYTNHDLDDGLRSGLLSPGRLAEVTLWRETQQSVRAQLGDAPERVLRSQGVLTLINRLVTDVIEGVAERVDRLALASVEEVRDCSERIVRFSPELDKQKRELKKFLYAELYHHPQVLAMNERAVAVLGDLFAAFRRDPARLPESVRARIARDGEARAIADYVAGMTDRFAMEEHARLGAGGG
jgi:dGTPase